MSAAPGERIEAPQPHPSAVRRSITWSALNSIALRAGGFAVGVLLARLLAPELFGVYAVALTVQTVLGQLADFGLSAELIRSPDHARRAPTVATLSGLVGVALSLLTVLLAVPMADSFDTPDAAGAIAVLGGTFALAGIGVVPYATLVRRMAQRELFFIAVVDLVVSTAVTLALFSAGAGVLSLAIGRLCAQTTTTALQFAVTRQRPRFGLNRALVRPILAFGLPVAGANLLSWALLNVDNVVIARVVGATALGLYVLAFNVASWPMTVISQVVRSIALPLFAESAGPLAQRRRAFGEATALTTAIALPASAALAVLASPLIALLYGGDWAASAPVVTALAVFGGLRAVFDVFVAYLTAAGRTGQVLLIQLGWMLVLVAGMLAVAPRFGIVGAAWVHVLSAVLVILPAYLIALHRLGVPVRALGAAVVRPVAASLAAAAAGLLAVRLSAGAVAALLGPEPWAAELAQLLLGLAAGALVYGALAGRWLRERLRAGRPPAVEGVLVAHTAETDGTVV